MESCKNIVQKQKIDLKNERKYDMICNIKSYEELEEKRGFLP